MQLLNFASILRTYIHVRRKSARFMKIAQTLVHSERKMEKVISLLAPRAGSANGRLVPRPAKKRKEAAWPPCCAREQAHVYNRLVSINGDACNCCCERSIASSRWISKKETRGWYATMRRK